VLSNCCLPFHHWCALAQEIVSVMLYSIV